LADLAPLSRRSVVDAAVEVLRARILHGTWAPGERLPAETDLADALDVSRPTVREALNRLASSGLVHIPHGGTKTVREWRDHAGLDVLADLVASPEGRLHLGAIRAITEMRDALAPDVARLAALRRTEAQARDLVDRAAALDEADALEPLLIATLDWWTALVLSSDNLAYRLAYNTLRATYTQGRPALLPLIEAELRAVALYRRVSAAVAAGEPEAAHDTCAALVTLGSTPIFAALAALSGG
jgi:GntR family transcriptional repressor for pyruvate dehydrogenase complex